MFMKTLRFSIFTFISCFCIGYSSSQALQCYVCENCPYPEDLTELQICGSPGLIIQTVNKTKPSTSTPTATGQAGVDPVQRPPSTNTPTVKPVEEEAEYEEYEEEQTDASETETNISEEAEKPAAATPPSENEDYYEEYEEYDERLRFMQLDGKQTTVGVEEPVCYIIRIRVNDTTISNRGCATINDQNRYETCKSLYDGRPIEECLICNTNGCNKHEEDIVDPWLEELISSANSSLISMQTVSLICLILNSLFKFLSH